MKKVLFLCTGNYYRSRFAEYLFNHLATEKQINWQAFSRELALERGIYNVGAVSKYVIQKLNKQNIKLGDNISYPVAAEKKDFKEAAPRSGSLRDRIIALDEKEHRLLMTLKFRKWTEEIEYWQVRDIDFTSPEEALQTIAENIYKLIEELE